MATMTVKDAANADVTVEKPLAPSRAAASASRPVVLSDEDYAALAGWLFTVPVTLTTTAGPYSQNDIIGGLLTFTNVARATDEPFAVTGVQVALKPAVTANLTLVLFDADPSTNAHNDNDAYSIAAADIFKSHKAIPVTTLTDHGTPNTYSSDGLFVVCTPISGTRNIYGLLFDATSGGITLTGTSDVQVRLRGTGK